MAFEKSSFVPNSFHETDARLWEGRQVFDAIAASDGVAGASAKAVHNWHPQGYLPPVSAWSKRHQRTFPSTVLVSFCALLRATGRIDIFFSA